MSTGKLAHHFALGYHGKILSWCPAVSSTYTPLQKAAVAGDVEYVRQALSTSPAPLGEDCTSALVDAAGKGHLAIVELLLPLADPLYKDSEALGQAADKGHLQIVQLIWTCSNHTSDYAWSLRRSIKNGHMDVANWLVPRMGIRGLCRSLDWAAGPGKQKEAIFRKIFQAIAACSSLSSEDEAFRQEELEKVMVTTLIMKRDDLTLLLRPCVDQECVAQRLIQQRLWVALDHLATGHPSRDQWLEKVPPGSLPRSEAIQASEARLNQLAQVPSPSDARARPRA